MKSILAPACKIVDGLSFSSKFFLVGALLLLSPAVLVYILLFAQLNPTLQGLVLVALGAAVLGAYFLAGTFYSITETIASFASAIARFSNGDLAAHVQTSSRDQLGSIATSFNDMRKNLKRMIA